jgi:hypothetical protein
MSDKNQADAIDRNKVENVIEQYRDLNREERLAFVKRLRQVYRVLPKQPTLPGLEPRGHA